MGEQGGFMVSPLREAQLPAALELAFRTFLKFEGPDYGPEGIETFRSFLKAEQEIAALDFYGAFCGDTLCGMLAMRSRQHIALFFVEEGWQRRGVGRALFERAKRDARPGRITVNASPAGVPAYLRLDFFPMGEEQVVDGMRFTPMGYLP